MLNELFWFQELFSTMEMVYDVIIGRGGQAHVFGHIIKRVCI